MLFCVFSYAGGHFFGRTSGSPRSVVCEMELPDIQTSLDMYDENKSWGRSPWWPLTPVPRPLAPNRGAGCVFLWQKTRRSFDSRGLSGLWLYREFVLFVFLRLNSVVFVIWKLSLAPCWSLGRYRDWQMTFDPLRNDFRLILRLRLRPKRYSSGKVFTWGRLQREHRD